MGAVPWEGGDKESKSARADVPYRISHCMCLRRKIPLNFKALS